MEIIKEIFDYGKEFIVIGKCYCGNVSKSRKFPIHFPFLFSFSFLSFSLCFFFSFFPDLFLLLPLFPMCSPSLSRARCWPYFGRPILNCPATPRPKIGPVLFTMLPSSTLYMWFATILVVWEEITSRKPLKMWKTAWNLYPYQRRFWPNWPKLLTGLWSPLHHKPIATDLTLIRCRRREKSVVKVPAT